MFACPRRCTTKEWHDRPESFLTTAPRSRRLQRPRVIPPAAGSGFAMQGLAMIDAFAVILAKAQSYRKKYKAEIAKYSLTDVTFIVSFPKSGRTWHRAMIGSFLSDLTGHHQSDIFNIDRLATDAGIGGIRYTHNGANFTDGLHPSEPLVASADLWRGHRVILIVRDVRDIVVSAWHHARYREGITSASLSEFVRHPMTGIEKVLVAYNRWFDQLAEAAGLLVVSYEDMTADPVAVLRDSLVFIGLTDPDPGRLVTAADQCRSI